MAAKPLWRQAFDVVDGAVAPRLEAFVQTSTFADAMTMGVKLQGAVRRRMEQQTRQLWHAANLPAGSDVTRLREQVAALDRQLRQLTQALESAAKEHKHADPVRPSLAKPPEPPRAGRTSTPRGRAQRTTHP